MSQTHVSPTPEKQHDAPIPSVARLLAPPARLAQRISGLPARFILPVLVGAVALLVAVLGMYWDIGYHIDHGRDENLLTMPHNFIVVGLQGILAAVAVHALLPGPVAPGERALFGGRVSLAPGAIQMLGCGTIALLGFPLDDAWHRLFGEDVTLWGPTHLFMIGGASFSTLGMWMLLRQGLQLGRPQRAVNAAQARNVGGLLIGLSTFQAEFDFGVPQFQLLYQPVLIAFAAGLGLVCARSLLGRYGALKALVMFIVVRGLLALFVGGVAGFTTPHFPLYVAEAVVVELAFLGAARPGAAAAGRLRPALLAGAGIGTLGLAAEWAWSHVWFAHPWTTSLFPEVAVLGPMAAIGGAVLGARIAQALDATTAPDRAAAPAGGPRPIPGRAVAVAGAIALLALAFPLPRTGGDGTVATVIPRAAGADRVNLAVTLRPADAARDADFFEVLAWQGRVDTRKIVHLDRVGPGRYVTESPVPVNGNWKSFLRLVKGSHLQAVPVYMPPSPESGRPGVPVAARTQPMQSDTFLLQREARGGATWVTTVAYVILGGIVVAWLILTVWSLGLLERGRERGGAAAPRRLAAA